MRLYSEEWDREYSAPAPDYGFLKDKKTAAEYYAAQLAYNERAFDDATVRENILTKLMERDLAMRERGLTPEGDFETPEGLEAINEQIRRVNSESGKDPLPTDEDLWNALLSDYGERAENLYGPSRPAPLSRIIGTKTANVEYYLKTASATDIFKQIVFSTVPQVILGVIGSSALSTVAKYSAFGFALGIAEEISSGKTRARIELGLERAPLEYEELERALAESFIGASAGIRRYGLGFRRPRAGTDDFIKGGLNDVPPARPPVPSSGDGPETRMAKYSFSTGERFDVSAGPLTMQKTSQARARADIEKKYWTAGNTRRNIMENFYKEDADGAAEYFGGLSDGDRTGEYGEPALRFRGIIEGGGDYGKRVRKFSSLFGSDGKYLSWAWNPKSYSDKETAAHVIKVFGKEFQVKKGEASPETIAELNLLKEKIDKFSVKDEEREILKKSKKDYLKFKEFTAEAVKPKLQAIADLRGGRREAYAKMKKIISDPAEYSKAVSEERERRVRETKNLKEQISDLRAKVKEHPYLALKRKYKSRDARTKKLTRRYNAVRKKYEREANDYSINTEASKAALRDKFAIYFNELTIENSLTSIVNASPSESLMKKNILNYMDRVNFLTRENLKDLSTIMDPALQSIRNKYPYGKFDEKTIIDFHREIKGESSGNWIAAELKKVFRSTDSYLRKEYAKYGIRVDQMKNYDPNNWSKSKVSLTPKEEFVADLLANIDMAETVKRAGLSPKIDPRKFAEKTYDSLVSSVREYSASEKTSSIEKQVKLKRIIIWKNGDSRYAMMNKYARTTDPLEIIRSSAFSGANNLAKLTVLGNEPAKTKRFLKELVLRTYTEKFPEASENKANRLSNMVDEMYSLIFDSVQFVKEPDAALKIVKTVFNTGRAIKLKGAGFTAMFMDPVTIALHASANERNPMKNLYKYYKEVFFPTMTKEEAKFLGILAEEDRRYTEEMFASALDYYGARFIEKIEKYNFADRITSRNKFTVNLIMMRELGSHASKKWDALPDLLKADFKEAGITPLEWEAVRPYTNDFKGVKLLNPRVVADKAINSSMQRGARKLQAYLANVENSSVPSFRTSGELGILGAPTRGYRKAAAEGRPIQYAAYRSMAMFTNITNAGHKAYADYVLKEGVGPFHIFAMSALAMFSAFLLGWAKELLQGKKPTDPFKGDENSGRFLYNSVIRTGVMNTNYEYAFSAMYQLLAGGKFEGKVQSDAFETIGKISSLTLKYSKAKTDAERRAVANDLAYYLNPLGTTPFAELYSRVVTDSMIKAWDPDANLYFADKTKNITKNGAVLWWAPGGPPFKEASK